MAVEGKVVAVEGKVVAEMVVSVAGGVFDLSCCFLVGCVWWVWAVRDTRRAVGDLRWVAGSRRRAVGGRWGGRWR